MVVGDALSGSRPSGRCCSYLWIVAARRSGYRSVRHDTANSRVQEGSRSKGQGSGPVLTTRMVNGRSRRYRAVGSSDLEGRESTRWSHSRSVETVDRPRPRANGSNRPSADTNRPGHHLLGSLSWVHAGRRRVWMLSRISWYSIPK